MSEGEKARSLLKWKGGEDMGITHHRDARGGSWLRLSLWRGLLGALLGAHHADDDDGDKRDDYNDAHDDSEDEEAD